MADDKYPDFTAAAEAAIVSVEHYYNDHFLPALERYQESIDDEERRQRALELLSEVAIGHYELAVRLDDALRADQAAQQRRDAEEDPMKSLLPGGIILNNGPKGLL